MPYFSAIYGYEISRPIEGQGFRIEPRTSDYRQAELWARDQNIYHLTAVVTGSSVSDSFLFDLEAVLSFVEHLDVTITPVREINEGDSFAAFAPTITAHRRSNGGGAVLPSDAVFFDSRGKFVRACMLRLADEKYCGETQFRVLFFKKAETFRQRRPFLEVSYFLLYSGLETYARAVLNDRETQNSSKPICVLLKRFGFEVAVERPSDLPRAISTYTHLRNSLFHNSLFYKKINVNGKVLELKVTDYLFNLQQLVSLVIMKAVGFDDGHVNWNSWIDRKLFK